MVDEKHTLERMADISGYPLLSTGYYQNMLGERIPGRIEEIASKDLPNQIFFQGTEFKVLTLSIRPNEPSGQTSFPLFLKAKSITDDSERSQFRREVDHHRFWTESRLPASEYIGSFENHVRGFIFTTYEGLTLADHFLVLLDEIDRTQKSLEEDLPTDYQTKLREQLKTLQQQKNLVVQSSLETIVDFAVDGTKAYNSLPADQRPPYFERGFKYLRERFFRYANLLSPEQDFSDLSDFETLILECAGFISDKEEIVYGQRDEFFHNMSAKSNSQSTFRVRMLDAGKAGLGPLPYSFAKILINPILGLGLDQVFQESVDGYCAFLQRIAQKSFFTGDQDRFLKGILLSAFYELPSVLAKRVQDSETPEYIEQVKLGSSRIYDRRSSPFIPIKKGEGQLVLSQRRYRLEETSQYYGNLASEMLRHNVTKKLIDSRTLDAISSVYSKLGII